MCFLDGSGYFQEPAGIACYAFEAFSRGCILLEQEMISFFLSSYEIFLRVTEFGHLLRML